MWCFLASVVHRVVETSARESSSSAATGFRREHIFLVSGSVVLGHHCALRDGATQSFMKERAKATVPEKGPSWNTRRYAGGRGGEDANRGGNTLWQKGNGKKGGEGTEKGGKEDSRTCWSGNAGRIAAWCPAGGNRNLCAVGEKESEVSEEAADNEAELQPWCLWEESEHEQWQEVIRRKDKQNTEQSCACFTTG